MQVRDKEQFRNTICNMQIKHVAQLRKVSRVEALRSLSKVERFPRLVLGGISFPRHTYALNYERTCLSARMLTHAHTNTTLSPHVHELLALWTRRTCAAIWIRCASNSPSPLSYNTPSYPPIHSTMRTATYLPPHPCTKVG